MEKQMKFKKYIRINVAEMMEYEEGGVLPSAVSISEEDRNNGSPKKGDMIARNPKNHNDMWLIAGDYFKNNFKIAEESIIFVEAQLSDADAQKVLNNINSSKTTNN